MMMMIALTHVFCSFSQLPSSLSFPSASFVKPLVGPINKKKSVFPSLIINKYIAFT